MKEPALLLACKFLMSEKGRKVVNKYIDDYFAKKNHPKPQDKQKKPKCGESDFAKGLRAGMEIQKRGSVWESPKPTPNLDTKEWHYYSGGTIFYTDGTKKEVKQTHLCCQPTDLDTYKQHLIKRIKRELKRSARTKISRNYDYEAGLALIIDLIQEGDTQK